MRSLAISFHVLAMLAAMELSLMMGPSASAQTVLTSVPSVSSPGVVCPQCGKVHAPGADAIGSAASNWQPGGEIQLVRAEPAVLAAGNGTQNVLSMLNQQRARQGIGFLQYDPQLQAVAQRRAQLMASMGLKNHPPGSFSPGRYEGVGWSSSFSPAGVSACYTSDSRMQYAGAAMATGRDGVYFAVVYR